MSEVSKRNHIYGRAVPAELYLATRGVARAFRDHLHPALIDAVLSQDVAAVRCLLEQGVATDTRHFTSNHNHCLLDRLWEFGLAEPEMSTLLRHNHAPLGVLFEASLASYPAGMRNPPEHERAPVRAYHFVRDDEDGLHMRVHKNQPPEAPDSLWQLHAHVLPGDTGREVRSLRSHVSKIRREEARQLRKYNWHRVRLLVQMRALAFHWMGETLASQYALDGPGRARDRAAYRDDFAPESDYS